VAVWVVWWVGLAYVSALVVDLWRLASPWEAVARAAASLARRRSGRPRPDPAPWLDAWPAVLLLLAFGWAELVWQDNAVPWKLAAAIGAYSLVTWAGMAVFGIERWLARGEAFALFFGLLGRFAPIDARTWRLRAPGAGLLEGPAPSTA